MLRGIGKALHRDDPRLASMLATFARLTDGEAMPGREQMSRRQPDAGQRCIWLPPGRQPDYRAAARHDDSVAPADPAPVAGILRSRRRDRGEPAR